MKCVAAVFCLLLGLYTSAAMAVSFRINPEINLLVLDGNKLPGSLLKGAESIELEQGQHQILFTLVSAPHSPVFILTFTAESHIVSMVLPSASVLAERSASKNLQLRLVDENGLDITAIQDHLSEIQDEDYVRAVIRYNRQNRKASVAKFSLPPREAGTEAEKVSAGSVPAAAAPSARGSVQAILLWLREFRTS
ncbi:hypothetical protein GCM10009414_34410 [Tatumella terrea]|uniref:YccT family protein n=1 Tax=Tatumella terrea TaxID=419007 RepID=UPI0031DB3FCF